MCDTDVQRQTDIYEVIQKQIFLNCVSSSSSLVSSSSSTSGLDEEVSVSILIDYLYKNFNETNQYNTFFEDLRKSLTKVSPNGRINWTLFKEGSRVWISKFQRYQIQGGNNNVQDDDDDLPRDSNSSGEEPKEDQEENDSQRENNSIRQSSLPFINVVNVSSYSPDSNNTQCLTDASADSEIDMGYDVDATIDLRLRIRKFDEENATLREEILRVEDLNASLQQRINSLSRRLEQLTLQNKNLQRENDEQKDLLSETEEREKSSKLELQKTLKEKASLEKKLEAVQKHDENITALKIQLAQLLQEKKKFAKQNEEYQDALKEKSAECESLKEMIIELEDTNANLQQSYESLVQYLREKNKELLNRNLELQARLNNSESDRLSITPPLGYINSYMHSTPYTTQKISPRKSLYAELKASGFSPERAKNDSKIAELEEELSWCNEEINAIAEQIESVIQRLAAVGQKPYVPHLNLQTKNSKIPNFPLLKQEIAVLMSMVTERIWKSETKDFSLQVVIESPKVHHQFSASIEDDFVALSESSMTSRSAEATQESAKSNDCSSGREISNIQNKLSQVQVQENSIIDPIVEALDQIIQDSIDDDSNLQKRFSTRGQKRRCIYTHTRPPTPNPELIITPSLDSQILNQNKEIHYVTSRGDAPEITSKKSFNPNIPRFYSADFSLSSRNTMRPSDISTDSTTSEEEEKKREIAAATYCITPNSNLDLKTVPRRKLSVFQRSFDVESLQATRDEKEEFREKKRSVSTPVQEEDHERKENQVPITRSSLLNSYRSVTNSSDSSESISPDKNLCQDEDAFVSELEKPKSRPIVLAPTKLIFPQKVEEEVKRFDETRIISKDSVLKKEGGKETDPKVFGNVTVRKRFGSDSRSKEEVDVKKEKDLKTSGDATFSKVSVRKGATISVSPVLFDSLGKIDETIYSDNSSKCVTSGEMKANFEDKITGVPLPIVKVCSTNGDNSGAVKPGIEKASEITPSVLTAMSSAEDSSDSECDRINNSKDDRQVAVSVPVNLIKPIDSLSQLKVPSEHGKPEGGEQSETRIREQNIRKNKRSLSESGSIGCPRSECRCRTEEVISTPLQALDKDEIHPKAFPNLSDDRLQESGIANFSDLQSEYSENLSEDDLERKYTALSVGLRTDRMTLSRRLTLSQRQRDQAERNLTTEVEKMQQDIQDLAPLCTDRESLERVERVRRQLEMIAQCAHRVSCVAETLGAVHQERRISRAALLADRYLQLLRTRCEKLAAEVNETKRILMENNIMIEEHPNELGDDIPRIRYRAVSTNNRTMMARRRASIAAISRSLGSQQELKEGPRQRNSVSGRVTFRRPSLSYETQKWENDKLVRTDSSSSIGELREIFEQAESRRNSREENNNVVRSPANYVTSASCETTEGEIWSHPEEHFPEESPPIEKVSFEQTQKRQSISSSLWAAMKSVMLHPIFWYMLLSFFFGFYVKHVFSSKLCAGAPFKWWSVEEFLEQYMQVKNTAPRPI